MDWERKSPALFPNSIGEFGRTPTSYRKIWQVEAVKVLWDDGTESPPQLSKKDIWGTSPVSFHFTKADADKPSPHHPVVGYGITTSQGDYSTDHTKYSDLEIKTYQYDASTKTGSITVDIKGGGIKVRHWVVNNIGEICSDKNITLVAGEETRKEGRYRVLDESVKDGLLTIAFEAVY